MDPFFPQNLYLVFARVKKATEQPSKGEQMLAGGLIWMLHWSSVYVDVCVHLCPHESVCKCVSAHGQASSRALPIGGGGRCSCVPEKSRFLCRLLKLVAWLPWRCPNRKRLVSGGRCRGEEEDKGRGEKGLYLRSTLRTSVWLDKKEEERKSSQTPKTGLDCLPSLHSKCHLNIKLLMCG